MWIGHGSSAGLRAVLPDAEVHARRYGHRAVGCEHLLLAVAAADDPFGALLRRRGVTPQRIDRALAGLLARPRRGLFEGVDGPALASLGIDLDAVRHCVQETFGAGTLPPRGPGTGVRVVLRRRGVPRARCTYPLTGRARSCLRVARATADTGPGSRPAGHRLVLAIVGVPGGLVPRILAEIGVATDDLRLAVAAVGGSDS